MANFGNSSIRNKLLEINLTFGENHSVIRSIRKEEVVLPRICHTRVTHSYIFLGEEQPQCVSWNASFTVRHFLLECDGFAPMRNNISMIT